MSPAGSNKHVLVTGGNQGIGLATALALAEKGGYDVTLACRNAKRAEAAVRTVRERNADCRVQWLPLELASLDSVRSLLELVRQRQLLFDVVVLNAGVLLPRETRTRDGLETTFQVNFLSHFLLVDGLVAHQCPRHPLKVVTLTSVLHRLCGTLFPVEKEPRHWAHMFAEARRWKAYALSKFATALLARHLNERDGVTAAAVHPGNVRTQMADGVGSPRTRKLLFFLKRILITPQQAAANVLYCVENELAPNEYRHESRLQKFPAAVCKRRNVDALVALATQLTAPFRPTTPAAIVGDNRTKKTCNGCLEWRRALRKTDRGSKT